MHAVATLTKITGRPAPFDFDTDLRTVVAGVLASTRLADCIVDGDTYLNRIHTQNRSN